MDAERRASTVVIRRFSGGSGISDARLARKILEDDGIACALAGDREPAHLYLGAEQVRLLVFKKDADRAAAILKEYFNSPSPSASEDESASE